MADRVSTQQRIKLQNLAEVGVMRHADDHALWHKHVHNVELDSMQILKCLEMDRSPLSIDFSCRRTGKTAVKELYLKHNATHPDQEEGIVAPTRSAIAGQSRLPPRRHSPLADLDRVAGLQVGPVQMADTYLPVPQPQRGAPTASWPKVDGGDLTHRQPGRSGRHAARPAVASRFLLMLGATRRLGAAQTNKDPPQIHITGVFGAPTRCRLRWWWTAANMRCCPSSMLISASGVWGSSTPSSSR